jgi:hypothetical protein
MEVGGKMGGVWEEVGCERELVDVCRGWRGRGF